MVGNDHRAYVKSILVASTVFLSRVYKVASVMSDTLRPYGPYSPPGSSVRGILQTRKLEWVAMPSSGGCFQSRDRARISYVSRVGRRVLYH